MARARQLEDIGRQLLGQLSRPDQPSLERPGPDPLSRPAAAVPRGPVREPQQARLCQRALDHLSRRRRQRPALRARRVEGDDAAVPGIPRRHDARGRAAARHAARAPGAARQPFDLPERDPRAPAGVAARPAQDRVLALRAARPGYARGDEARDPYRQPGQQRCGGHVRAGRRRQLAPGDRSEHEPHRAPAPPGSIDGPGACGAASGLSGARLRALHLGEQPAPLLSALGRVHERGELGRHPARPDQRRISTAPRRCGAEQAFQKWITADCQFLPSPPGSGGRGQGEGGYAGIRYRRPPHPSLSPGQRGRGRKRPGGADSRSRRCGSS